MTLKLTPQQAKALFDLFNNIVLAQQPNSAYERLLTLLMINIYKKLRTKWEGEPRKKYSLKLNAAEAIAYQLYWERTKIMAMGYEYNMVITHCAQIDREALDQLKHTFLYNS